MSKSIRRSGWCGVVPGVPEPWRSTVQQDLRGPVALNSSMFHLAIWALRQVKPIHAVVRPRTLSGERTHTVDLQYDGSSYHLRKFSRESQGLRFRFPELLKFDLHVSPWRSPWRSPPVFCRERYRRPCKKRAWRMYNSPRMWWRRLSRLENHLFSLKRHSTHVSYISSTGINQKEGCIPLRQS